MYVWRYAGLVLSVAAVRDQGEWLHQRAAAETDTTQGGAVTTSPSPDHDAVVQHPAKPTGGASRPLLLVVLAVVAALVVGGGAFAITRALSGGGDQPAGALPASTAAYLRVDINPSVGQKIAAVRFLQGLDSEVTDVLRSEDIRKEVFELIAEEEPALAGIDYDSDIAPWLGDRLGVGVVPTGGEEPTVAVSLQVKDQEAADAGLTRLVEAGASGSHGESVGWFFHDDYVVLAEAPHVSTIEQAVRAGVLEADADFAADFEALGDPGVLSFWVDGEGLAPYLDEAAELTETAPLPSGPMEGLGLGAFMFDEDLAGAAGQGRVLGAVRFGTDHIEVHGLTRDLPATIEGGDTAQLVLDLPEDTAVALGMEHGDQVVAAVWEQLSAQLPEEMADLQAGAESGGWAIPQDIATLLGQSLALSVGPGSADTTSMEDFGTFPLAYRVSTDTEAAQTVLDRVLGAVDPAAAGFLVRDTTDGVLTLGLDRAYVDEVSRGGSLGQNPVFRSAVPGAEEADAILYVNLNTYEGLYLAEVGDEQARASLEAIAAVGLSAHWSGAHGEFTLRVVAD